MNAYKALTQKAAVEISIESVGDESGVAKSVFASFGGLIQGERQVGLYEFIEDRGFGFTPFVCVRGAIEPEGHCGSQYMYCATSWTPGFRGFGVALRMIVSGLPDAWPDTGQSRVRIPDCGLAWAGFAAECAGDRKRG
ncbi:MAG: hypothetical protein MJE77_42990 [Proteobacteria bacterium]|nr:hypothetical protein [Pseudomonadota bacterium]